MLDDSLDPDFSLIVSANSNHQFSRESWLATATSRYTCSAFRYREVQIRPVNEQVAIMSSIAEFTAYIDGVPRTGPMFIIDVWRQGRMAPGGCAVATPRTRSHVGTHRKRSNAEAIVTSASAFHPLSTLA